MIKQVNDYLTGIPMTVVGGVFLSVSLALDLAGTSMAVNPAWATILISGIPLLYLAISRALYNQGMKKISSAMLISIAMIAAIGIGDVFAAGEVAFIMAIGAILEEKTAERAKKGLRKLLNLVPQQGRRITDGKEDLIRVEDIRRHDVLRILPGETVPVDGKIISGNTSIDQAVITGESLPVDKGVGDDVFCGTINRFGAIDIEATKIGEDSSLQKLIRMVQEAEMQKSPMERIADKWATWLVPVALLIAVITGFATDSIVRAVTVLVVFCPCALVLATPTAVMAAIGQATKYGVIIKSGDALERMGKVDTITFDKTGTLTYGNLVVSNIVRLTPN
jgi:ATPase, P-type (transporting), HAD superfamily, subfamily IC